MPSVDDGTRTGRAFFRDDAAEAEAVVRIGAAMQAAGLWDELATDWVLLDTEIMPWSAKAQELLRRQYLPTVAAARTSAEALIETLGRAGHVEGLDELCARAEAGRANAIRMGETIDAYCWQVETVAEQRIAPFHLLAAEGRVFADAPHEWHMQTLAQLAEHDPVLQPTGWRRLDAADPADRAETTEWWLECTARGGEGMGLKPAQFLAKGEKGLIQPAMKVRGRDYLRMIYGPDYDLPKNIERLRDRGLGRKFSLAEREFKLGLEGLYRFVERAPLAKVHECALAVLALESEPVDPRL